MRHRLLSRLFTQTEPMVQLNDIQQSALEMFNRKIKDGEYVFEDVPCLCGKKDSILIGTCDRYGLSVHTHLCKHCGIMWTSPRMTEGSLKGFYEVDYRPIYVGHPQTPDLFFKKQIRHGKKIHEYVESCIKKSSMNQLKVFDIGCGAGGTLLPFKENGWLTYGCDLGGEYLIRGKEEGLILEHGDLKSLSQHGPANLVILSHVLEHFSNPINSLNEISELLTEDGYIYIEVPGIFKIHSTYVDILLFLQNAHLYHFTLKTLSSVMTQVGFKLIKGDERICALFQKSGNTKRELHGEHEAVGIPDENASISFSYETEGDEHIKNIAIYIYIYIYPRYFGACV